MTKTRIAVVVSLLFAAPAVVIAQLESTEPATEVSVVTVEPAVVVTEQTVVAGDESATIITEQPALVATESTVMITEAIPAPRSVTYQTSGMNDPVFFQADVVHFQPLPAQARYLESKERERSMQYAATPLWNFKMASADEDWMKPLPAQMAYFDRLDRQRTPSLASSDIQPRSSNEVAQAGSAEFAIADSSAIR